MKIEDLKKSFKLHFISAARSWIKMAPTEQWRLVLIIEQDLKILKHLHSHSLIDYYIIAFLRENISNIKSLELIIKDTFPEFSYILERFIVLK